MLEQKPTGAVSWPPRDGDRYKVRTGDSWGSIAKANDLDTWALIEYNFQVLKSVADFQAKCKMVNWLLRNHVGCTKSSDGKNYRFDSSDTPGHIYIPLFNVQPTFTHRVGLHFCSLTLTAVAFNTAFRNAQRVYAQYGIRIDFKSGRSLGLSQEEADRLSVVNGSCEWEITTGEFNQVQRLVGGLPSSEILVCYVKEFEESLLGCGGHAPNQPACIVAAAGSGWTTAHEVGHVLLGKGFSPVHSTDTTNLMYKTTLGITSNPPKLTPAQVEQIKKSPCCVSI